MPQPFITEPDAKFIRSMLKRGVAQNAISHYEKSLQMSMAVLAAATETWQSLHEIIPKDPTTRETRLWMGSVYLVTEVAASRLRDSRDQPSRAF